MTEKIKHIQELLENERFIEADIAIKDAITKYPDSPEIFNLQGELQLKTGNLEEAIKIFSDIRKNYPANLEALNNLAVCMIYGNEWDRATNLLLEILRKDPSNEGAKENLDFIKHEVSEVNEKLVLEAKSLIKKGLISEAEKHLERVIYLNNKHMEASIYLAAIKMKNGAFQKADQMLTSVTEITSAQLSAAKKREEEEDNIENNMYWVFGSGRSGSSWFTTQLLRHEGTLCWNEPLLGTHLASIYWEIDRNSRLLDRDARRPDYFFSSVFSGTWRQHLRKMIIHRVIAQYPEALKKKIIIKEPNGSFAADVIMETLVNAKIIFLLRDGRDILDSKIDMYRKDSWAQQWVKLPELNEHARSELIKKESTTWLQQTGIVNKAFNAHDAGKRLLIKYEDLRYDTSAQLRKVYDFIGIDISDEELRNITSKYSFENIPNEKKGEGKAARKAKPGNWKDSFTGEEIQIMDSIMGDQLRVFGYNV